MAREKEGPAPRELLIRVADRARLEEQEIRHPMNPLSEVHGITLSRATGLERVGVNLLRVPPGKESFAPHVHWTEEEFVFVLSGTGVAEIGDESFAIGPGDFLGFPAGSHPHHLRNTGAEPLVYLSGGEHREIEVSDFPRDGQRLVRIGKRATVYALAQGRSFFE